MLNFFGSFKGKTGLFIGTLAILSIMGAAFWLFGERSTEDALGRNGLGAPKPAHRFELKDSSGKSHALDDYAGNLIFLHFWASWCPPCIEELPEVIQFAEKFQKLKVQVLAIALDDHWDDAFQVLPKAGLPNNFIPLLDAERVVSELYGSYQFPESYLIDQKLNIFAKWVGAQEWLSPAMEQLITKMNEMSEPQSGS